MNQNYYELLEIHPSASAIEIRQAYRRLSKKYHPDTTSLSLDIAMVEFQSVNEAYATISNPTRRLTYDRQIGYARGAVVVPPPIYAQSESRDRYRSSAYLDPTDRPLSGGELFALLLLLGAFMSCLLLAIGIGIARGEFNY